MKKSVIIGGVIILIIFVSVLIIYNNRLKTTGNAITGFVTYPVKANHPRLLLTQEVIARIQQKIANNDSDWLEIKKTSDPAHGISCDTSSPLLPGQGYRYQRVGVRLQDFALCWFFTHNETYAQKAVTTMETVHELDNPDICGGLLCSDCPNSPCVNGTVPGVRGIQWVDSGYDCRDGIFGFGLAYDWMYDYLNSTQKQEYLKTLINFAGNCTQGYMPMLDNYYTGKLIGSSANSIAAYGDDPAAEIWFNKTRYGMWDDFVNYAKSIDNIGLWQGQYDSGIVDRYGFYTEMVKSATGEDLFANNEFIWNEVFYHFIDVLAPDKISYIPYSDRENGLFKISSNVFFWPAYAFPNKDLGKYSRYMFNASENSGLSRLLYYDNSWNNNLNPYSYIPTDYRRPGTGGLFMMRTDWSENATFVSYECGDDGWIHAHFDLGNFNIWKNGWLTVELPEYGWDGVGNTQGHNSVVIGDLQQYKTNSPYCKNRGIDTENNFTYVRGELTDLYNSRSSCTANLTYYSRDFIYLKPGYVIVLDRINANDKTKDKKFLMHFLTEPNISGQITDTNNIPIYYKSYACGDIFAGASYKVYNANTAEYQNQQAKLRVSAVFPDSVNIRKINETGMSNVITSTPWRIEIMPSQQNNYNYMLNVIEVADINSNFAGYEKISSSNKELEGVKINDYLFMFATNVSYTQPTTPYGKAELNYFNESSYSYSSNKITQNFIAELAENTNYEIYDNDILAFNINSTRNGTLSFSLASGAHQIKIIRKTSFVQYNEQNLQCDSGTIDTTCYINHQINASDLDSFSANNLIIQADGWINSNITDRFRLNLAGDLTIEQGGKISGGYLDIIANNLNINSGASILTEGIGSNVAGNSHGGYGGNTNTQLYGSADNPEEYGIGAKGGGGIIRINAKNNVVVNGVMSSDGISGGSGGSIYINSSTLQGTGNISASGGTDSSYYYGNGGGGGRIRISDSTNYSFLGIISTNGGLGGCMCGQGTQRGHAGTIIFPFLYRQNLIIKSGQRLRLGGDNNTIYDFGNITIESGGILEIDSDPLAYWGNGSAPLIRTNMLNISQNGLLSAEDLGRGYSGAGYSSSGGSYGGIGKGNMSVYGDAINPKFIGSGGGYRGISGGALLIEANELIVNGNISASSIKSIIFNGNHVGAATGGTINIWAIKISGTGKILAKGAVDGSNYAGGGRIYINYTLSYTFSGELNASGGNYMSSLDDGTVILSTGGSGCASFDSDNDGYYSVSGCGTAVDCNDSNSTIHPGATELCDGIDNDCDGVIDEGCPDILAPSYSNIVNPASNNYSAGNNYLFSINWQDNRGISAAGIEFNHLNYTLFVSGNTYTRTFSLAVGNYNYYFWANDTSNNINKTQIYIITINKANPSLTLTINPNQDVLSGTQTSITTSCPSQLTCNLYRNNILVIAPDTQTLAASLYNYTYNTTGNQNYTLSSVSKLLNISNQCLSGVYCPISFNLTINSGINFISIPLNLSNNNIAFIFQGNLSKITSIYSYNSGWQRYYYNKPEFSSFSAIEAGEGYVIIASNNFTQSLQGARETRTFNLNVGWNLIGTFSSSSRTLSSIVSGYNASFEYNGTGYNHLNATSVLDNNKAYWIYMNNAGNYSGT